MTILSISINKKENVHDWKASFVFSETIEAMHNLCLIVYFPFTIYFDFNFSYHSDGKVIHIPDYYT